MKARLCKPIDEMEGSREFTDRMAFGIQQLLREISSLDAVIKRAKEVEFEWNESVSKEIEGAQ